MMTEQKIIARRDTLQHSIEEKRQSIRADMAAFNASGDEVFEARIVDTVKEIRAIQPELWTLQAALKPPPPPPLSQEERAGRERAAAERRKRDADAQQAATAQQRLRSAFQQGKTPEEASRKSSLPLREVRAFYDMREKRAAERNAAIARNKLAIADLMNGLRQCDVVKKYGVSRGLARLLAERAAQIKAAQPVEISRLQDDAPIEELQRLLKVRTWNALHNEQRWATVGEIRNLSKADLETLMRAPNFGRSSLKDLCTVAPELAKRWGRKL